MKESIMNKADQIPEVKAKSTASNENRFPERIYLRVNENGTISPVEKRYRRRATHYFEIEIEYPKYSEELDMKSKSTTYDEHNQIHYTDYAMLTEHRVQRCLVRWDLHKKIPGLTKRLHRVHGFLEDDSMELWRKLPPPIRKTIADLINIALGPA